MAVLALVAAVGMGSLLAAGPAAGRAVGDVSASRLQVLVREAAHDPTALAALRQVTSVDGRPLDVGAALAGATGAQLQARLRALEAGTASLAGSRSTRAGADRKAARRVVGQSRFHAKRVPRPLRGVLQWIGDRVAPPFQAIWRWLTDVFGSTGAAVVVTLLVVGLAVPLAIFLARGRSRVAARAADGAVGLVDPRADPVDLERRADAAEADGHLSTALRFRYEAGLLRLARADRLELRPDTTTGDARVAVAHEAFDRLTLTFEDVVYGGRPATADDLAAARAGWAELLAVGANR